MKKGYSSPGYNSPTYSSNQKTLPNVNMRERIVRLTETVNELRTNVETEVQNQDTLEKISSKNYALVTTQIRALKNAFNTLADVIMEELDGIKSEVTRDYQEGNTAIYRKLEELGAQVNRLQHEKQEQKSQIGNVEQDLRDRIIILERRQKENVQDIHVAAETSKEDYRAQFEKLNNAIRNNTAKIDQLTQENARVNSTLNELTKQGNEGSSGIKDLFHKIREVEDELKHTTHELANKLGESRNQIATLRDTLKGDLSNSAKTQTELTRRVEEISVKTQERAHADQLTSQKRFSELEDLMNQVQHEFQENVQELAKIHKESSTQIIVDFEKAITGINNDNKVLYKKFAILEGSISKTREELGTMIADHEHLLGKKNENLNQAIYDICRRMNIPNPLH